MNKLNYLSKIYNQELFLSRNYTKYFEGWYFKNSFNYNNFTISFIPGVCKNEKECYAFIQVIATIPFKIFSFTGHIATFMYNDNQYIFDTYNLSNYELNLEKNILSITLKKRRYKLKLIININNNFKLISPNQSKMNSTIFESVDSNIKLEFYIDNNLVVKDSSNMCCVEVVK